MPGSLHTTRPVREIVDRIKPMLAGHPSTQQGAALADLLSIWLASHFVKGGEGADESTRALRETLLTLHVESVRALVGPNAAAIGAPRAMYVPGGEKMSDSDHPVKINRLHSIWPRSITRIVHVLPDRPENWVEVHTDDGNTYQTELATKVDPECPVIPVELRHRLERLTGLKSEIMN